MTINHKDITVILLLYKTPLHVIKNLKIYKNFNIFILDQSNDLKLKKELLKLLPNIKYYKVTNINLGYAKAINFLIRKVKTKYFLCTQADVVVSKNDIINLKKPFLLKKDCIISIPNIDNNKSKKKKKIFPVKSFIGAIFLSQTKKFINFRGFDQNFFFYWEDVDFSHRVSLSKYKIYINSSSKAKHLFGQSTKTNFKIYLLKNSNFKFGEYLFQHKYNKLKLIKKIREPFLILLKLIFFIATFNRDQFYKNLSHLYGIYIFYLYLLKNN